MRVVFDPNVLISAAVTTGVSAELFDRWFSDRPFELVTCPALIAELRDVLARPKFRRWIAAEEAAAFVDRLDRETKPGPTRRRLPPSPETRRTTTSSLCIGTVRLICWCPAVPTCSSWKPPT